LAYSYDGINWTGLGATIFSISGYSVAWNGTMWISVGSGTNTIAYSFNGLNWVGLGSTSFITAGNDIAWNGQLWIAVGQGGNSIAWSVHGISGWTGLSTTYLTSGCGICWSGKVWMASGIGPLGCTVFSPNGKIWFSYPNNNTTMITAYDVGFSNFFTNKLILDSNNVDKTQTLDIVPDSYYQTGFSQICVTVFTN
jgi:hypothetical protein